MTHIISLLVAERDKLDRAINALGADPATVLGIITVPPRGSMLTHGPRRKRTPEERRIQSLKMKAYWAKRRKGGK